MRLLGNFSTAGGSAAGLSTGNNLLHPPAASSTRSTAVITATTARVNTWDTYAAKEAPAAAQPAASQLPAVLPNLQPISSVLSRQLQREQQQRKRLRKQLQRLEGKLCHLSSLSSSEASGRSWLGLPDPEADSADDPLFSSSTPPSVQQLQRLLVHCRSQLLRASSSSISDVARVAGQLQDIASHLNLDINLVIPLVARHEPLLLQPPHQLPPRLALLSATLQLHPQAAADLLSSSAPQLLGTSLRKLQSNVLQLDRIFSSRGIKLAEVLQARPDLLTQNPSSVEGKLEQLPGALGMSRQRVRQLVSQCPDLLRLSVGTVSNRYHSLRQLFSIPDSFVEEFVVQEPELLCMNATTLKAKFESLLRRYGAFADDVLDMVLVDPALLINADPTAVPPAPTVKASRKKQQKLMLEQQQQQLAQSQQQLTQPAPQQQQPVVQDPLLLPLSPDAAPGSAQGAAGDAVAALEQAVQVEQPAHAVEPQQVHQVQRVEEPWEVVLRLRLERRQAAKDRRRLRQQECRQQQAEQLRLRPGHMQQQQRVPMLASNSKRQSPVRRLLAFAAVTGLSGQQALQLWQQEPSLSLLPAAAVGRQVAELSHALGLQEGGSTTTLFSSSSRNKVGSTQGLLAAAAAGADQQQQWQPWREGVLGSVDPSGSSKSDRGDGGITGSRLILQVLVKEPLLLVLSDEQLSENMQGLCNLLGLQVPTAGTPAAGVAAAQQGNLLPLLWEQPGLLLLPPDVGEYRLQHLAGLLQLSVPRALQLVLQQPQLLTERPVLLASRLGSLCTLLGVARGVASECVLREPRVLCVDEAELQGRWEALVGRFGWAPDALDVVMADPAALMRDSLDD